MASKFHLLYGLFPSGANEGIRLKRRFVWFVALAALLVFAPGLRAQENATINGTVTDASGAVVANARLTLTNTATSVVRAEVSNSVGAYRFGNVGIGTYDLTATAPGFQTFTKTGIVVNVSQTLEEDVAFKVGSATQTVSVQAEALQTQTETSEVSTLISGQQVEQLATNGRNVTALAALGLGVTNNLPEFSGVDALTSANGISFNGTRTEHNIYLLDGAEQNDRGCGGCFMNLPSQESIAEFQTLDSNYQPDYGIGSGGTILLVLKSGTKDYHGELYEFNRNTDYNANDYFVKKSGKPRPTFQLNEPGGNIGGPLWIPHVYNENRNRTFFFWNEEWRRLIQGSSPAVANTIPANDFPTAGASLTYTPFN
ncbi:MAG: carboxypeptidase-like regulatory domain-containing protein, partial [Acidobacteriaceae bacterium]